MFTGEASGKSVGANGLDGLSLGCDHNGVFFLQGSFAELRLFRSHVPPAQRIPMEVPKRRLEPWTRRSDL